MSKDGGATKSMDIIKKVISKTKRKSKLFKVTRMPKPKIVKRGITLCISLIAMLPIKNVFEIITTYPTISLHFQNKLNSKINKYNIINFQAYYKVLT